jgi:hypothetical protein
MGPVAAAFIANYAIGNPAQVVSEPASVFWSQFTAPYIIPTSRQINYNANSRTTNLIAPLEAAVTAFYKGTMDGDTLADVAARFGAGWDQNPANPLSDNIGPRSWQQVIAASKPSLTPEIIFTMLAKGRLTGQQAFKELQRGGAFNADVVKTIIDRQWAPDVDTLLSQLYCGVITPAKFDELAGNLGLYRQSDKDLVASITNPIGVSESIELWTRKMVSVDAADSLLAANGYRYGQHRELLRNLAQTRLTPGMGQLIDIWSSGAANSELSANIGLIADYPDWLDVMSAKLGISDRNIPVFSQLGGAENVSWGQLLYGASRQRLSNQEAINAYLLFRPGRTSKYIDAGINVNPFTAANLDAALGQNNVPPGYRGIIAALGFRRPRIFDIRRGIQFGILSDAAAVSSFQDIGYTPADANYQLSLAKSIAHKQTYAYVDRAFQEAGRDTTQSIVDGYVSGIITYANAEQQLQDIGFGLSQADALLQSAQVKHLHGLVDASIKSVQRRYFSGVFSAADVVTTLTSMQIVPEKIQEYLAYWAVEHDMPRKTESALTITRWHKEGYIDASQATNALSNLGYNTPESLILVAEAEKSAGDLSARLAASQSRTKAQQAKQLAALQKQHLQQANAIAKQLKQLTPLSTLKRWLKKGIIDDAYMIDRMHAMGYPDDVILKTIEDATSATAKQSTATPAKTAAP